VAWPRASATCAGIIAQWIQGSPFWHHPSCPPHLHHDFLLFAVERRIAAPAGSCCQLQEEGTRRSGERAGLESGLVRVSEAEELSCFGAALEEQWGRARGGQSLRGACARQSLEVLTRHRDDEEQGNEDPNGIVRTPSEMPCTAHGARCQLLLRDGLPGPWVHPRKAPRARQGRQGVLGPCPHWSSVFHSR